MVIFALGPGPPSGPGCPEGKPTTLRYDSNHEHRHLRSFGGALRGHALPSCGPKRHPAAENIARPVAQLRRRGRLPRLRADGLHRLRPRHHPLRPGQQLRTRARGRRAQLRADSPRRARPLPRRAFHLDQGGLHDVEGPLRRPRKPQVSRGQPRPEPAPHGARLRRHLLLAPHGPRDAARGDDGGPLRPGAPGQDALRRLSNYRGETLERALALLRANGTPCLLEQSRYSMFSREVEQQVLPLLEREHVGLITFSPLAQGCSPTAI